MYDVGKKTDEEQGESIPLVGGRNNQSDTSSVAFFSVDHYRRMSQQCAGLNPILGVMVVASLITVWFMWLDRRRDVAVVGWDTCNKDEPNAYSEAHFQGFKPHFFWCTSDDDVAREEVFTCRDQMWRDTGLPTGACAADAMVEVGNKQFKNFNAYGEPHRCCSLFSCDNFNRLSFSCPETPKPPENSGP